MFGSFGSQKRGSLAQGRLGFKLDLQLEEFRNLSMKMRHLRQQFGVAPVRYLVMLVC
jgi:hypothetical protein